MPSPAPSPATGASPDARRRSAGTILVALDGSGFGESALSHARVLARALDRPLHLVTVLDPALTGGTVASSTECRLQLVERERYLAGLAKQLADDGFDVRFEAREGEPTHEVVATARERGAGMVVLASRPRRGAEGIVSRGVAQGVISSSDASLLVARGGRTHLSGARSEPAYHRIAVGVDGSSVCHRALQLASLLARTERARLVLIHVMSFQVGTSNAGRPRRRSNDGPGSAFATTAEAGRYLQRLERRLKREQVEVRTVLCRAPEVAGTVETVAGEERADLLVLGARGAGQAGSRYGHCARRLLLHAATPVLVVRGEQTGTGDDGVRGIGWHRRPGRPRAAGRRRPERAGTPGGS